MASEPWYRGVPPVEVELQVTAEARHRIAWRNGRLVLLDHPDPAAEQALVALGGESCPCFEVLTAWRKDAHDVVWYQSGWEYGAQALWREYRGFRERAAQLRLRGPRFPTTAPLGPGRTTGGRFAPGELYPRGSMAEHIEREMRERLLGSLPTPLLERLSLGLVVRRLRFGEPVTDMARIRLREHVVDGLTRCVRAWGPVRRPPSVDVQLWLTTAAPPQVVGLVEAQLGYVEAVLPSRWLITVHARGLAVVDGCFVVDAHLDRADHGTVEAVHFARTCSAGWTPVQQTMEAHRTPKGTWHLC